MSSVLFGSISTVADTSEVQRQAFNRAFAEHGLELALGPRRIHRHAGRERRPGPHRRVRGLGRRDRRCGGGPRDQVEDLPGEPGRLTRVTPSRGRRHPAGREGRRREGRSGHDDVRGQHRGAARRVEPGHRHRQLRRDRQLLRRRPAEAGRRRLPLRPAASRRAAEQLRRRRGQRRGWPRPLPRPACRASPSPTRTPLVRTSPSRSGGSRASASTTWAAPSPPTTESRPRSPPRPANPAPCP